MKVRIWDDYPYMFMTGYREQYDENIFSEISDEEWADYSALQENIDKWELKLEKLYKEQPEINTRNPGLHPGAVNTIK